MSAPAPPRGSPEAARVAASCGMTPRDPAMRSAAARDPTGRSTTARATAAHSTEARDTAARAAATRAPATRNMAARAMAPRALAPLRTTAVPPSRSGCLGARAVAGRRASPGGRGKALVVMLVSSYGAPLATPYEALFGTPAFPAPAAVHSRPRCGIRLSAP